MTDKCPDCGVAPGQTHVPGCDVEQCPRCGGQAIGCDCIYKVCGMDPADLEEEHPDIYTNGPTGEMEAAWDREWESRRIPWSGEWPGMDECREFGWYCRENPDGNPFWVRCEKDEPGAREDLNRLYLEGRWDVDAQRFVRGTR